MSTVEENPTVVKHWGSTEDCRKILVCSASHVRKLRLAGLIRYQKVAGLRPQLNLDDARKIAVEGIAPARANRA